MASEGTETPELIQEALLMTVYEPNQFHPSVTEFHDGSEIKNDQDAIKVLAFTCESTDML